MEPNDTPAATTEDTRADKERERLLEEAREARKQLEADLDAMTRLHKVSSMFLPERSPLGPVLTEIVDAAIALSGADFGSIQILDAKTFELEIAAERGFPAWWLERRDSMSIDQGTGWAVLERGQRIIIEDVEQSSIFVGTPALEMQRKAGVRAVQSPPLFMRSGKPIGILLIDDVLDLSKIEARRITISPEPVSVRAVLDEVIATLGPMAARAEISRGPKRATSR